MPIWITKHIIVLFLFRIRKNIISSSNILELFFRFCFFSLLAAFAPSALLFLKGRYGAKLPMGPFFLAGWAAANCLAFPVLPL